MKRKQEFSLKVEVDGQMLSILVDNVIVIKSLTSLAPDTARSVGAILFEHLICRLVNEATDETKKGGN